MQARIRFTHVAIATAIVGTLGAVTAFGVAPLAEAELPVRQTVVEPLALDLKPADTVDRFVQTEAIRRGDTLASLLSRIGAADPEFLRFAAQDPTARGILQLRAGRVLHAELDSLGRVHRLAYRLPASDEDAKAGTLAPRQLVIQRADDHFTAAVAEVPLDRWTETRSVEIRSSLFAATDAAGIPEAVALQVAEIFGSEIDFQRDFRKGDRLRVVYESARDATAFDAGVVSRILAIELITGGKRYDAYWFEAGGQGDYYSFDGKSLRKSFLRNPLEVSRMTSGFTEARMHPILREWRAHKGVDFAAPVGTRVRASAEGTVEFVGQQRGYGNVVILKHRNQMSSLYAHLHEIEDRLKVGAKVGQGEVVGSVGQTGWATGPHLHYEVKVNGEQVDPMTLVLPEGRALASAERRSFQASVAELRAGMTRQDTYRVARFQ